MFRVMRLKGIAVGFAGTDAQGMVERGHENLSVANLPGSSCGGDCFDYTVRLLS